MADNLADKVRLSSMSARTSKSSYHHGDLPDELMRLAVLHIAADGTEKLSLRALAREAGVSQTAPYRHFPTKRCLLAAVATQGFEILRERMLEAIAAEESVEQRFISMGVAYVDFALTHPTHYHLMFGAVLGDFSDYDMLLNASAECFATVTRVQHELVAARGLKVDEERLAGVVWAGVHGIASLQLNMGSKEYANKSEAMNALATVRADVKDSISLMFSQLVGES